MIEIAPGGFNNTYEKEKTPEQLVQDSLIYLESLFKDIGTDDYNSGNFKRKMKTQLKKAMKKNAKNSQDEIKFYKKIQQRLQEKGYNTGGIDGDPGKLTFTALFSEWTMDTIGEENIKSNLISLMDNARTSIQDFNKDFKKLSKTERYALQSYLRVHNHYQPGSPLQKELDASPGRRTFDARKKYMEIQGTVVEDLKRYEISLGFGRKRERTKKRETTKMKTKRITEIETKPKSRYQQKRKKKNGESYTNYLCSKATRETGKDIFDISLPRNHAKQALDMTPIDSGYLGERSFDKTQTKCNKMTVDQITTILDSYKEKGANVVDVGFRSWNKNGSERTYGHRDLFFHVEGKGRMFFDPVRSLGTGSTEKPRPLKDIIHKSSNLSLYKMRRYKSDVRITSDK